MRRDELTAIGELTGDTLAGIAGQIYRVHDGIARVVWSSVGPLGAPVRITHDLIASGAYGAVQRSLSATARTGARVLAMTVPQDASSVTMTLRGFGQDLDLREEALRAAIPDATGKLAVFVHGLGETDDAWWRDRERNPPYGTRLRRELGYTPLFVRYNSGRAAGTNGRELAAVLERLSAAWPVAIDEIVLIGHAMGGLVARSACHHGANATWRTMVSRVITLGSPGRGGKDVPFAGGIDHYFVDYRRFGSLRRLRLLADPEVYEQIRTRLAAAPILPTGVAQRP